MKITWHAEDGYMGADRPQHLEVDLSEFEGMDLEEIHHDLTAMIDEEFLQRVSWSCEIAKYAEEIHDKLNK